MNDQMSLTIKTVVEGLGDAEQHTLDQDTVDEIDALITENLRERYTHLDEDSEIDVMALTAPNTVAIHHE